MVIECAMCGKILDDEENRFAIEQNKPGACWNHQDAVYEEVELGGSMWPSHWNGHNCRNPEGVWHELPSDDGDYDIVD